MIQCTLGRLSAMFCSTLNIHKSELSMSANNVTDETYERQFGLRETCYRPDQTNDHLDPVSDEHPQPWYTSTITTDKQSYSIHSNRKHTVYSQLSVVHCKQLTKFDSFDLRSQVLNVNCWNYVTTFPVTNQFVLIVPRCLLLTTHKHQCRLTQK